MFIPFANYLPVGQYPLFRHIDYGRCTHDVSFDRRTALPMILLGDLENIEHEFPYATYGNQSNAYVFSISALSSRVYKVF